MCLPWKKLPSCFPAAAHQRGILVSDVSHELRGCFPRLVLSAAGGIWTETQSTSCVQGGQAVRVTGRIKNAIRDTIS